MRNITLSSDHVYRVDGRIVTSVTQAISRAGLDPNKTFYNKVAMARGNDVHAMLEHFDLETLDLKTVPPKYTGYLHAYNKFKMFNQPVWKLDGVEQSFYNEKYDYCGTKDRVGSIIWQGKRVDCVLDLKTGPKALWHGVQLAGYNKDHRYDRERFGLYIKANKTFTLHHYTNDGDYEAFLRTLRKGEINEN